MMVDEEGRLGYARLRGSLPDLSGPTFPRTGDLIVAELCSWDCDTAMERLMHERALDEQAAALSIRPALEQDLGRTLLRAVRRAGEKPAKFVVPIGTQEVHVEMSLKPLNPQITASDAAVVPLVEELVRVAEQVRGRHSRDVPRQD